VLVTPANWTPLNPIPASVRDPKAKLAVDASIKLVEDGKIDPGDVAVFQELVGVCVPFSQSV
jgi:hypothetical protein